MKAYLLFAAALLALIAGCAQYGGGSYGTGGSTQGAGGATQGGGYTLGMTSISGIGPVLTDSNGYTLYTFSDDSGGQSACYGTCAGTWPPLTVSGAVTVQSGITGTTGTIQRTDGTTQVTYNGKPLYRYAADGSPGEARGQGFLGKWYAAAP